MIITPNRDVDADKWADMSFDELQEQKYLLSTRYEKVVRLNKDIAAELLKGIAKVESILATKTL